MKKRNQKKVDFESHISFRVRPETKNAIYRLAKRSKNTIAGTVRDIVLKHFQTVEAAHELGMTHEQ